MNETIKVTPGPGLKVRREDGRGHIAAAGETVALTTYVRRRLAEGDLTEAPARATPRKKGDA